MQANNNFGEKLQSLRRQMGLTQKEFAELLDIPQPSVSAYENSRNSPTMEVLIAMAQKCNVSLDWLCGLSPAPNSISTLGDIARFLYMLCELNEVGLEIEIHDRLPNDLETEEDKWFTRLTIYGNDKKHKYNSDLCNIIRSIKNDVEDLESFSVSKEIYDISKDKTIGYYNLPLTPRMFAELSREDRLKKHIEYLKLLEEK